MIKVGVKITERPKLMTREAERIWDKGIEEALDFYADVILGHARETAPVGATNDLANRLFVEKPEGRAIRFVTSPHPYAVVMEDGRAPGRRIPPHDPIALWVRRVLQVSPSDKRFESVVYLLRKKIAREGIRAKHFFARAAELGEDEAREIFDRVLAQTMRKLERPA